MTDAEIVRHLAEKVMGWVAFPDQDGGLRFVRSKGSPRFYPHNYGLTDSDPDYWQTIWNPLESIADALAVQAALPEEAREPYMSELLSHFNPDENDTPVWTTAWQLLAATARQRCIAIVEATR